MLIKKKDKKEETKLLNIPTRLILPRQLSLRDGFGEEELCRLADNIKRYGLLQPLKVRELKDLKGGTVYELISGERRLRACKLLCIFYVPCIVYNCDDKEALEISLSENQIRSDLNMFEQAQAYDKLMKVYMLTVSQISKRLSVSESYITNKLKLLSFAPHERQMLLYARLNERQALTLLKLPLSEDRIRVINCVIEGRLSGIQIDSFIDGFSSEENKQEKEERRNVKAVLKDTKIFVNTLEKSVAALRASGISVEFNRSENGAGDMVFNIRILNDTKA